MSMMIFLRELKLTESAQLIIAYHTSVFLIGDLYLLQLPESETGRLLHCIKTYMQHQGAFRCPTEASYVMQDK